jgi:hypothetical protein
VNTSIQIHEKQIEQKSEALHRRTLTTTQESSLPPKRGDTVTDFHARSRKYG